MNNAKTILVVEDERSLLEAIKLKLVESGFNAVTARSVEQALSLLRSTPHIDAIWLDHYVLGGESGLDLVSRLKSEGADWVNIPIFVVSNTASNEKVTA